MWRIDYPNEFHSTYEASGMWNGQRDYFEALNEKQTKWVSESEFIADKFIYKIMLALMPGSFKKQSLKFMVDFKNYCEKGESVADS